MFPFLQRLVGKQIDKNLLQICNVGALETNTYNAQIFQYLEK